MSVVDVHAHLFPAEWASLGKLPPSMFDVPGLLERQEEGGVDVTIVSDPHIFYGDLDVADIAQARVYNDFAAELQRSHPGRIVGLGSVTPWRGAEHIAEAERAVRELGLPGLAIATSDRGQYLESVPDEFWEAIVDLGVPVFVHPGGTVIGQELMQQYRLGEVCGRPLDMTVTLSRFILWGVYERFPSVRLLCAHAGGAICTVADRLDFGHELRDYAPLGPWGDVKLGAPPSSFVAKLHLDTVTYGVRALRTAHDMVGAGQLYLGSDGPPVPFPLSRSVAIVDALGLAADERAAVVGGNAERLFGLTS